MNEPMYPDLPPKPTPLEKLLLFMVAGLTVAVIVLGVYVSSQGDKIEQLQVGSSDVPTDTPTVATHFHDYAPYTHEHSQPTSTLGSPYALQGHFHRDYADENHMHYSPPTICYGTTDRPNNTYWDSAYERHTHDFNC